MMKQLIPLCLFAVGLSGCAQVYTETFIPAPPEEVWATIIDPTSYPCWHPVVIRVEGDFVAGEQVTSHVKEDDGSVAQIPTLVKLIVPNQELNQSGGIPGILTFDHQYLLQPTNGGTQLIQQEKYRGIGVWFWDHSWVSAAYSQANENLKNCI